MVFLVTYCNAVRNVEKVVVLLPPVSERKPFPPKVYTRDAKLSAKFKAALNAAIIYYVSDAASVLDSAFCP